MSPSSNNDPMARLFATAAFGLLLNLASHAVLSVQVTDLTHETCTYANGAIWVTGVGGQPPYTYSWADGPTTAQRGGLTAGSYTVTVTDALSEQASITVDIFSNPYALTGIAGALPWCGAPGDILEDPQASGVANTWTVNGEMAVLHGAGQMGEPWFIFNPMTGSSFYTYPVDDGNGCTGTISGSTGDQVTSWPALTINSVEPSCMNQAIGAIHVQSAGPAPGSSYGPWVNLIRDDGEPQFQAMQPAPGTFTLVFGALEPGYYGIHWWLGSTAESLDPGECSYDTIWVTVPDLGATCGSVQGTSYFDLDGDCTMDVNEVGIPYSPLLVQPGNEAVITNGNGQFAFGLFNGSYTLEQTDPTLVPICPATQPVPFTVSSDLTIIDLANGSTEPLDLRASLSANLFRPGFNSVYHVVAHNESPQQSGPVTVTLELDPALTYVSSEPTPVVNGSTLTWNLGSFTSFQWETWHVTVNVPVGTTLGTPISSTLTVSNTLPDADATNDNSTDSDVVVGSFDPNDKRAQTSTQASGSLYFINEDEWIDYTIRFQNTGTFAAEFVVISDTIAPELDMLSFEQGAASHPFTVDFKPGRVIEWRFDDIQLPDSTSDEPGSHGAVKFRMRPTLPLTAGAVIENTAGIYFDYNEPVITEPSVLVAEFSTAVQAQGQEQVRLQPNPAADRLMVKAATSMRTLRIIAADGREVLAQSGWASTASIDVSGLQPGAYLLIANQANGREARTRFIKQ